MEDKLKGISVKLRDGDVEDFDVLPDQFLELHEFRDHLIIENASCSYCFEREKVEKYKHYSFKHERFKPTSK